MSFNEELIETRSAAAGWVEAAIPTHRGKCPDCVTQTTGPSWDYIDDFDRIAGAWGNGQCGGCGQLGKGWIMSGARRLPADPEDHELFIDALQREVLAELDQWAAVERSTIRARLLDELRRVCDELRAVGVDPAAITPTDRELVDEVCTGRDTDPGVYFEGYGEGVLHAWDHDPTEYGSAIIVGIDDFEVVS
jgi:hypothetical protein